MNPHATNDYNNAKRDSPTVCGYLYHRVCTRLRPVAITKHSNSSVSMRSNSFLFTNIYLNLPAIFTYCKVTMTGTSFFPNAMKSRDQGKLKIKMGEDTVTSLMATYQLPFSISPSLSSHARSPEQLPLLSVNRCILRRMPTLSTVAMTLIVPVFLIHASLPKQLSSPTSAWLRKHDASPSQLPLPIDPEFSLQALNPRLCFMLEAKRTICQV